MSKLSKLTKEIVKRYGASVSLNLRDDHIELSGELDNWNDIVSLGLDVAKQTKRKYGRLVNNIRLAGFNEPEMKVSSIIDKTHDNMQMDILVVGGGVIGCAILRELTKYNVNAVLVEKEEDVALHASSRNDGQVHIGIDLKGKINKLGYCLRGNEMYSDFCKQLDVEFERVGQYVAVSKNIYRLGIPHFAIRARKNKIKFEVVNRRELFKREPNLNSDVKFAMVFPMAGIVCPYNLTIALAENAIDNGAKVLLNTAVTGMNVANGKILSVQTNRGTLYPKVVVNAAGVFADKIAEYAQDKFFSIHPRKGTNCILDKSSKVKLNNGLLAGFGSKKTDATKHTKGGGVIPTVDGNVLIGPNAYETPEREDNSTLISSVNSVVAKQSIVMPNMNKGDIITYFSGTRAATYEEDFVIECGHKTSNIVYAAGIQSPGLTAAPAIALDVAKLAVDNLSKQGIDVGANAKFNGTRHSMVAVSKLAVEKRNEMIEKNNDYGKIICRCEEISKGEIIDALNRPLEVNTVDGIKRRIRPGMGRCQGGFCQPLVLKIMAEEKGVKVEDICKRGEGKILLSNTKGGELSGEI